MPEGEVLSSEITAHTRLWNFADEVLAERGVIQPEEVRVVELEGVIVDTGATRLVFTQDLVRRLGLPLASEITVRYADGRTARKSIAREWQWRFWGAPAPLMLLLRAMGKSSSVWRYWKVWTCGPTPNVAFLQPTLNLLMYLFITF